MLDETSYVTRFQCFRKRRKGRNRKRNTDDTNCKKLDIVGKLKVSGDIYGGNYMALTAGDGSSNSIDLLQSSTPVMSLISDLNFDQGMLSLTANVGRQVIIGTNFYPYQDYILAQEYQTAASLG